MWGEKVSTLPTPSRLEASFLAGSVAANLLGSSPVGSALSILEKSVISEQIRTNPLHKLAGGDHRGAANRNAASQEKILTGGRSRAPYCSRLSARFRNWCRGGRFRRRRGHVFFDEIPDHHREQERDQLRAPVFQRQSGPQDGNQYRAPVLRGLSLHNCCAAKFSAKSKSYAGK
jgi:hypothetical protein